MTQVRTRYSSNNSGGYWWLTDDDWLALARDGWDVQWFHKAKVYYGGRWLGALASEAYFPGSYEDAVASFESITGQNSDEQGCRCCGQPHYFSEEEYEEDCHI